MKSFSFFTIVIVCLLIWQPPVSGQLILMGCTGNVTTTSPPSSIVDINLMSGAATNPRNTGVFALGGIAYQSSTNTLFGLTTFASTPPSTLVTINPLSGAISPVGPTGLPNIVEGDLAINPVNGFMYGIQDFGATSDQRNLFQINPANGVASVVGNLGTVGDFSAMAFDITGTLFAIDSAGIGDRLVTIDPTTGAIVASVPLSQNLGAAMGMAFHPTTGLGYVADGGINGTGLIYTLNPGTGVVTSIGPTSVAGGIAGLTFVSVPEPTSIFLTFFAVVIGVMHRSICWGAAAKTQLAT